MRRRKFLSYLGGAVLTAFLTGCPGNSEEGKTDDTADVTSSVAPVPSAAPIKMTARVNTENYFAKGGVNVDYNAHNATVLGERRFEIGGQKYIAEHLDLNKDGITDIVAHFSVDPSTNGRGNLTLVSVIKDTPAQASSTAFVGSYSQTGQRPFAGSADIEVYKE